MKFTNAIVLLGSLIAPAVINAKTCGNDGTNGTPVDGKTRVKIICVGDAADFGVAGDKVDCFREQGFDTSVCKDIFVTIRYKIINPSGEDVGGPDFDMFLESASFGQGFYDTKNLAVDGARQINYDDLNPSPVLGTLYQTAEATTHNMRVKVNTCNKNNGKNNFFMKMKLKPSDNDSNTTSKCGTNKFVKFNNGIGADARPDFVGNGLPNADSNQVDTKNTKASKAPSVKKSKAPAVKTSKAPAVKTSKAPSVKTSKAPAVKKTKAPSGKAGSRKM